MAATPNSFEYNGEPGNDPSWKQILKFTISFLTVTCGYRAIIGTHWNKIIDGLYLGALPIKTEFNGHGGHHEKLIQQCKNSERPLGLVVSVVQKFEIKGYYLPLTPVSPEDWEHNKIRHLQVQVKDFTAEVTLDEIEKAMWEIHLTRQKGLSVYVHCKAGVARSWMFVMCYLSTYCGFSIEQAEQLVKQQRPQVSPCDEKRHVISNFLYQFQDKIKKSQSVPDLQLLLSPKKDDIPKSNSTNDLAKAETTVLGDILALDDFEEFMQQDEILSKTKPPLDIKP